ncbi:helix-turn-helix domain-containing protein, partial [Klebsiella pneumoniae]
CVGCLVGHLFMFLVGGKTPDQSVHLNLTTTGKPVNEVALSLGYDNASSFATMFRRVTGQPPSFYHPA